jgi:hypothetical protein
MTFSLIFGELKTLNEKSKTEALLFSITLKTPKSKAQWDF